MTLKATPATKNALLNAIGLKEQLDDGFLYIFSGTAPATAAEALNMATTHTELAMITVSDDGTTGLTFDAPLAGVISKAEAETWSGTCDFDGFNAATTQTATFFRYCAAGDNGRGAADGTTGYRIQGSVTALGGGGDLQIGSGSLTDGVLQPIGAFSVSID